MGEEAVRGNACFCPGALLQIGRQCRECCGTDCGGDAFQGVHGGAGLREVFALHLVAEFSDQSQALGLEPCVCDVEDIELLAQSPQNDFGGLDQLKSRPLSGAGRRRRAGNFAAEQFQEPGHDFVDVDGLGNMVVHAGGQTSVAVAGRRIGGHGQDWDGVALCTGANAACGFQPVQVRHLHVHDDHVIEVGLLSGHADALQPAFGNRDVGPFGLEQLGGDLAVQRVVFHQQNAHRL